MAAMMSDSFMVGMKGKKKLIGVIHNRNIFNEVMGPEFSLVRNFFTNK